MRPTCRRALLPAGSADRDALCFTILLFCFSCMVLHWCISMSTWRVSVFQDKLQSLLLLMHIQFVYVATLQPL